MPVISTNTAANTALRYLNTNSTAQSESLAKLSSGSRIVSAKDDASGLAIATSMNADITVLNQAATNVTSGTSVLNTADGALSNIADILQRMKSLTAQAQSGSSSDDDLSYINAEYTQLKDEIDDIASTTNFNGVALLSSSGTSVATTLGTADSPGTLDTDYFKVATGNTSLGAVSYLADGTATTVEVGDYVDDDGALLLNADGTAKAEVFSALVSFAGEGGRPALKDADGSALVIHANADDHSTQPIGGAGDRVACAALSAS